MEITPIDLRVIDQKAANVYEAIIASSKRARQINAENKIEFTTLLGNVPNLGLDDDTDDIENPAQIKISLEFEKRSKPHIQAINELLEGKIEYTYKNK